MWDKEKWTTKNKMHTKPPKKNAEEMLESKEAFRHRQIFKMKIRVETLNTQFDTNEVTKSMSSTSNTVTTVNIFILESNE